jgi:hypothetical protein
VGNENRNRKRKRKEFGMLGCSDKNGPVNEILSYYKTGQVSLNPCLKVLHPGMTQGSRPVSGCCIYGIQLSVEHTSITMW